MSIDEYLLDDGLLWRRVCQRFRHPAPRVDGVRRYACHPRCPLPDTPAIPVEQTATLAALIRAYAVLHGIDRNSTTTSGRSALLLKDDAHTLPAAAEEARRWESCPFTDRRAVLRTAYHRLEIDADGVIHRIWRHHTNPGSSR